MKRLVVMLALFALASCGWNSSTRLIPVGERAIPDLRGEYVFEGRTVTYGRRLQGNLFELRLDYEEEEPSLQTVAFDHLRTLRGDGEITDFYLIEVDNSTADGGPRFGYDLIEVTTMLDEDGRSVPKKYVSQYNLQCADATDRLDRNSEEHCEFSRYSDLMLAVDDLFAWMDDPRIALQYDLGSQPD